MTFIEQYQLATDAEFIQRTAMGVLKLRNDILNELPSVINHANRLVWANSFSNTDEAIREALACMVFVVTNPGLTASPSDSDIEYSITTYALPIRIKSD